MGPLISLVALLLACGGAPEDPSKTPAGKTCSKAYGSTVDSVTKLFHEAGQPAPKVWPDKAAYVEKCMAIGLTEGQGKCLDPKIAQSDPEGCKKELEPVKAKVDDLSKWFGGEIEKLNKDGGGGAAGKPEGGAEGGGQ